MSLLKAEPSQFQLTETGNILFQKTLNNPTLGDLIAKVVKGENIYVPKVEVLESDHVKAVGESDAQKAISAWLATHVDTVLEPLKRLETVEVLRKKEDSDEMEALAFPEEAQTYAKAVMDKLHDHMGVIHRSELAEDIQKLDEDARRILRAKRVKLGPILVFLPELNKPKGVRLRGLLWSLWNEQALPAQLPSDGAVSIKIDAETVNKNLHLAVSYPVYANRAIRIDMLDRVINAIYDSAKDGKFEAQHAMAEWLGCSIEDLYDILSAMGHKRIVVEKVETLAESVKTDEVDAPKEDVTEDVSKEETKPVQKAVKPQLDTFWLKKGQAHKSHARKPSFDKKKSFSDKKNKKPYKKSGKPQRKKEPMVMSAEAEVRPEDNPFAILGQLKSK